MDGVGGNITCTKKGIYQLKFPENSIIYVSMFYSEDSSGTTISYTDIIMAQHDDLDCWWQFANIKLKRGDYNFSLLPDLYTKNFRCRCITYVVS